ncbi:hypothetical protein ACWCQL_38840 [Streptomyces sp. NPDC002073]
MPDQPVDTKYQLEAAAIQAARPVPRVALGEVPPSAIVARDQLLAAIGNEAQRVAETSAGQASAALAELAGAYAAVTSRSVWTAIEATEPQSLDYCLHWDGSKHWGNSGCKEWVFYPQKNSPHYAAFKERADAWDAANPDFFGPPKPYWG